VDTRADTVFDVNPALPGKQAIVLTAQNPVTTFQWDAAGSRLLVGCTGAFGVLDGGVEAIDPDTFQSLGLLVTEAALGGDIGDLAWNGPERSYAIVSDASFNTHLVSWSAVTGTRLATLFSPGGFSLPDCAIDDRGELYVCHSDFLAPALYVFDTATDTQVAGPLGTGLPPQQIVFDEQDHQVLAVGPLPATGLALAAAGPTPSRTAARFTLRLPAAGAVRAEVFDPGGRRVRRLFAGVAPAGETRLTWDLRSDGGTRVFPGLYWIRVSGVSGTVSARVAVLD